jgi:diamine N-acetyltransferase
MLQLTPVDKGNWVDCIQLRLEDQQKGYLASNLETIAESKFETHYVLRAITLGEKIIGMLAYCPEVDEPVEGLYWLFRIMIDLDFQGKGYGKEAIRLCLEELKQKGANKVKTMCKESNAVARTAISPSGFTLPGILRMGTRFLRWLSGAFRIYGKSCLGLVRQ